MHGKVFLACALGGGIGALVALQIWQPFWWVGLLIGGLVGYLAYDFKEVIRAIPRAWAFAVEEPARRRGFTRVMGATLTINSVFAVPFLFLAVLTGDMEVLKGIVVIMTVGTFCLGMFFGLLYAVDYRAGDSLVPPLYHLNAISIYGYYLPRGIWWVVRRTPKVMVAIVRAVVAGTVMVVVFAKYLFILIHSELRLLCAFDAAFGAAIGYFAGNALIGALAGGAIGVLNYEIVSKRLLHLVPSR